MKQWDFYKKFHARGMSLRKLAEKLGTTHSHLSQVFSGTRGAHTRKHIARFLTEEETKILGWTEIGEVPATPEPGVPQGTLSQAEH